MTIVSLNRILPFWIASEKKSPFAEVAIVDQHGHRTNRNSPGDRRDSLAPIGKSGFQPLMAVWLSASAEAGFDQDLPSERPFSQKLRYVRNDEGISNACNPCNAYGSSSLLGFAQKTRTSWPKIRVIGFPLKKS
jgi:hypothetical protein